MLQKLGRRGALIVFRQNRSRNSSTSAIFASESFTVWTSLRAAQANGRPRPRISATPYLQELPSLCALILQHAS
jgi:hypothetical protein